MRGHNEPCKCAKHLDGERRLEGMSVARALYIGNTSDQRSAAAMIHVPCADYEQGKIDRSPCSDVLSGSFPDTNVHPQLILESDCASASAKRAYWGLVNRSFAADACIISMLKKMCSY